jgi:hypothetical protein
MDIVWKGNVRDLVTRVADSDARSTYVDDKTGAKIRINIDGGDFDEDTGELIGEPFYIESPDGENLYDAFNRKEAIMILSNIRRGERYPDQSPTKAVHKTKKRATKHTKRSVSGVRTYPSLMSTVKR